MNPLIKLALIDIGAKVLKKVITEFVNKSINSTVNKLSEKDKKVKPVKLKEDT